MIRGVRRGSRGNRGGRVNRTRQSLFAVEDRSKDEAKELDKEQKHDDNKGAKGRRRGRSEDDQDEEARNVRNRDVYHAIDMTQEDDNEADDARQQAEEETKEDIVLLEHKENQSMNMLPPPVQERTTMQLESRAQPKEATTLSSFSLSSVSSSSSSSSSSSTPPLPLSSLLSSAPSTPRLPPMRTGPTPSTPHSYLISPTMVAHSTRRSDKEEVRFTDILKASERMPKWEPNTTVHAYLRELKNFVVTSGWPMKAWIQLMQYAFTDKDLNKVEWVNENIIAVTDDWNTAAELFDTHFKRADKEVLIKKEFYACYQKPHETVQEYGQRLSTLVSQLGWNEDNPLVLEHFERHLQPDVLKEWTAYVGNALSLNPESIVERRTLSGCIKLVCERLARVRSQEETLRSAQRQRSVTPPGDKFQRHHKEDSRPGSHSTKKCIYHPQSTTHSTHECRSAQSKTQYKQTPQQQRKHSYQGRPPTRPTSSSSSSSASSSSSSSSSTSFSSTPHQAAKKQAACFACQSPDHMVTNCNNAVKKAAWLKAREERIKAKAAQDKGSGPRIHTMAVSHTDDRSGKDEVKYDDDNMNTEEDSEEASLDDVYTDYH